jgi:hypothetical protein
MSEEEIRERERLAFLAGAKWWEWHKENATMWQSDQELAYAKAEEKYPAESQAKGVE